MEFAESRLVAVEVQYFVCSVVVAPLQGGVFVGDRGLDAGDVDGEGVLRDDLGSGWPVDAVGEEACRDAGRGLQRVEGGGVVEAEFLGGLAQCGLFGGLVVFAAAHGLPDVHVLSSEDGELELVAEVAEGDDEDLERGLGHVGVLGQCLDAAGGMGACRRRWWRLS